MLSDLSDLFSRFSLLEGFKQSHYIFPAKRTVDSLEVVLLIVAQYAVSAEGMGASGGYSEDLGFCEAEAADFIVKVVCVVVLGGDD